MGKFDEQLARNKQYLLMAEQDLKDLAEGHTHSFNDVDMSPDIKKRAETTRDISIRLIKAYEKLNAK